MKRVNVKNLIQLKPTLALAFSLMLSVFMISNVAFAQPPFENGRGDRGAQSEKALEHLTEKLNLNADQQAQVKVILEEGKEKRQLIQQQDGDRNSKRAAMQNLKKEQETAIMNVLNADQQATFKEMIAKRDEKMKERVAQGEAKRKQMESVDRKALKAELKKYHEAKVKPVMTEYRAKLDPKISADDQNTIDYLRTSMKDAREQMKALRKAKREGKTLTDDEKAEMRSIMDAKKADMEKAKKLAEKYEAPINTLLDEMKPQAEQWKTDIDAIFKKYGVDNAGRGAKAQGKKGRKGNRGMRGQRGNRGNKGNRGNQGNKGRGSLQGEDMDDVMFLLYDPNASIDDFHGFDGIDE